jgi:hypothetical protein
VAPEPSTGAPEPSLLPVLEHPANRSVDKAITNQPEFLDFI